MGIRGELYSTQAHSEKRTYFFNVKENRVGDVFMNIVESAKGGAEDEFKRHQILVYEEEIDAFMKELQKAVLFLKKKKEVSLKAKTADESDKAPEA